MSGARGTSSPPTVTAMPRSNQSVADAVPPAPPPPEPSGRAAASVAETWMSGRLDRLAVVGLVADDLDLEVGDLAQRGQDVGGEVDGADAVEPQLGHEAPRLGDDLPQRGEGLDRRDLVEAVDEDALGGPVAHRVGVLVREGREHPAVGGAVPEGPLEVRAVARLVGEPQRQPWRDGLGEVEGAVEGAHPGLAPQPGEVGDGEPRPVGLGDLDDAEVEQALAGAVERLGEGAEDEDVVVAQPEARRGRADEVRPPDAAGEVEVGPQLGAVVGADDVDDELGGLGGEGDLARAAEVGEQPDAGPVGSPEQPHPPGAEVVELDGVGHPAVAEGADRPAVRVGDRGEGVAVLVGEADPAEAVVPAGEGLPRDAGADPAAAHARHHGAQAQGEAPALGDAGAAGADGLLDEQAHRGVLGRLVGVVEQATEGALPRGARRGRGPSGEAVEGGLALAHGRGDGDGVLAVAGDRARAGAVPAADLEPPGRRRADRGERDPGRVGLAAAAADPALGLAAVVGDLEVDDVAVLGVGEAARHRDGAADLVELAVREVGDAVDGEHPTHHTTSDTTPTGVRPAGP